MRQTFWGTGSYERDGQSRSRDPAIVHMGRVQHDRILDATSCLIRIFPPLMSHFKDFVQSMGLKWVKVLDEKQQDSSVSL